MQRRLADPDRRVGPDLAVAYVGVSVFDSVGSHPVRDAECTGVVAAQSDRAVVDVDRVHHGTRAGQGQGYGDWTVAATEVEQSGISVWGRGFPH